MIEHESEQPREKVGSSLWRLLFAPALHELIRSALLLALLIVSVWIILEIFRS